MVAQQGLVKVLEVPQNFCFQGTAGDILTQIANHLAVQLPETISNVVVSASEPSDIQNTALWVRTDNAGNFIGLYVVSEGNWTLLGSWNDWSPSFGAEGGMNYTASANMARYVRIGDTVTIFISATGTISGTPSTNLTYTLPFPAASAPTSTSSPMPIFDVTEQIGLTGVRSTAAIGLVSQLGGTAWNVGADKSFFGYFTYQAAPL